MSSEHARISIVIEIDVVDEQRLRRIAATRMSRSGYGGRMSDHENGDLAELTYQAILGSNPDDGFDDLGVELVSYQAKGVRT